MLVSELAAKCEVFERVQFKTMRDKEMTNNAKYKNQTWREDRYGTK